MRTERAVERRPGWPVLLVLLALAACESPRVGTADRDPGPPAETSSGPRLAFTAPGHDFGEMERRETATHTAVFYNAGASDLVISRIVSRCGCAAALTSDTTLAPGERGTLEITLQTGGVAGEKKKAIELYTNDTDRPVASYLVRVRVLADVMLDPMVLAMRTTAAAGGDTTHFDVRPARPGFNLEVRDVTTSGNRLRTEVVPRPDGGDGVRVLVRLEDGVTGDFHDRVTVHTNSPRDPRLTAIVIGSIRQEVTVVPERLYFPSVAGGRAVTRKVFLSRSDGRPLTVHGVEDPAAVFDIEPRRVDDSRWEVSVTLSGEAPESAVRGSILFLTDSAAEPRVAVPFTVSAR
jgi:hypothetical protein